MAGEGDEEVRVPNAGVALGLRIAAVTIDDGDAPGQDLHQALDGLEVLLDDRHAVVIVLHGRNQVLGGHVAADDDDVHSAAPYGQMRR